jgi:hypothetical protein
LLVPSALPRAVYCHPHSTSLPEHPKVRTHSWARGARGLVRRCACAQAAWVPPAQRAQILCARGGGTRPSRAVPPARWCCVVAGVLVVWGRNAAARLPSRARRRRVRRVAARAAAGAPLRVPNSSSSPICAVVRDGWQSVCVCVLMLAHASRSGGTPDVTSLLLVLLVSVCVCEYVCPPAGGAATCRCLLGGCARAAAARPPHRSAGCLQLPSAYAEPQSLRGSAKHE